VFCTIFFFEMSVRFMAFRIKFDALLDYWFIFDTALVALMVWETWIMVLMYLILGFATGGKASHDSQVFRVLRLVRLVRVARATRILQAVPELLIIARGMLVGIRSVLAVLVLLMLIIYVYAVMFTMMLKTSEVGLGTFDMVPTSMNTLLMQVLCGPQAELMRALVDHHWAYYSLFLSFLLVAVLTLMNMLIGILCDVMSNVASEANEEMIFKEVKAQIKRLATEMDADGSGTLDREEFDLMIKDPQVTKSFHELGVDVAGVAAFAEFIFEQCDEISFGDFGLMVGQFRGKKVASVQDVMDLRRYVTVELLSLEGRLCEAISTLPREYASP